MNYKSKDVNREGRKGARRKRLQPSNSNPISLIGNSRSAPKGTSALKVFELNYQLSIINHQSSIIN